MVWPLTIFIISLIGLVFLIVHKMMEMRTGRSIVSPVIRERGDALVVEKLVVGSKVVSTKLLWTMKSGIHSTKEWMHQCVLKIVHLIHESSSKLLHLLKRKNLKKDGGSVSFFLKQIGSEEAEGTKDQ